MSTNKQVTLIDEETKYSRKILEKDEKSNKNNVCPPGYIPLILSGDGNIPKVPKEIFIKNFTTEHLIELSLLTEEMIPEKLIEIMNSLIYVPEELTPQEKEKYDVGNWPEAIVIECIVKLYVNYFSPILHDVPFPFDIAGEDREFFEKDPSLVSRSEKVDIDLTKLHTYDILSPIPPVITIKSQKKSTLLQEASFVSLPRMRDVVEIQKWLRIKYADITPRMNVLEHQLSKNPEKISEKDRKEYYSYIASKTKDALAAAKMNFLVSYVLKGERKEITGLSLNQRIELYQEIEELHDITLTKKLNQYYDTIKVGIIPEVEVIHPITKKPCIRRYTFRFMEILQAIQSCDAGEYDIFIDY